jgi:hypothetical protein
MEILENIFIDLSFNTVDYILNATNYINNGTTFQWYEISENLQINLGTSSIISLNHTTVYEEGDKIVQYICEINNQYIINFYINYKTFFNRVIEYNLQLIGNPLKLDISYAQYTLEYNESQVLDVGSITGGIAPYSFLWYENDKLIENAFENTYLVIHNFDIIEPVVNIFKTYYCKVRSFEKEMPINIVRFDVIYRAKPIQLNAVQNIFESTINAYNNLQLKIQNIIGGRKPLTVIWKRNYPNFEEFIEYKRSLVEIDASEAILNITNYKEFLIYDNVIIYQGTLIDALGIKVSFNYEILYKKFYLSEPCFPSGTLIKVYNENDELVDIAIEHLTVGTWIPSNDGARVKVKGIYSQEIIIQNGDMHRLKGVNLFKSTIISSNGYIYNYINNPINEFDGFTVTVYHIETPDYLKYDILMGEYYIKSYGNHNDSLVYDGILGGYITINPPRDTSVIAEDDVIIPRKPLYLD